MYKNLLILLFLVLSLQALAGGGWVQNMKSGYIKLGQSVIVSDKFFTPNGDIIDITTTGYYATFIYGEIGITDRLTGILYFPFFSRSTLNERVTPEGELIAEGDYVNSVGDTDISLKYGIIQNGPIVLSAGLTFGIPIGESAGGYTGLLQTGDGEFNQMLSVEASHSFYPKKYYLSAILAFNNRTKGFSDEFRYGLEFGATPGDFICILRIYGVKSLYNGDNSEISQNGLFNNNMEYFSISPEINYLVKEKIGLSLSAGFAAYGKNLLAAPLFTFGLFTTF